MTPKLKDDAIRNALHDNLIMLITMKPETINNTVDNFITKTPPKSNG